MPEISKKAIIIALAAILVLAGSAFAYGRISGNRGEDARDTASGTQDGINYDPPTEEEQAAGDKRKEEIAEEERKREEAQNQTGQKTATVIITDAGQYDGIIEVRSFIPDHYQDGTCTITFRKGGQSVVKETPARKDVSTTICMNPLVKRSEFPSSGTWQVTVAYSAPGAKGTSETRNITIN